MFSSSSGWIDSPSWIWCELFISRGSHRSKGRLNRLGNGLGRPAYPLSRPPRSPLSRVDSSHLLEFMSFTIAPIWTLLFWRYLRGKDRIENPSLNLYLLCLIPKYLISSLWAWSFGLSWRMDVDEWASNQHGICSFLWALAFVFLRVSARSRASSFHAPK